MTLNKLASLRRSARTALADLRLGAKLRALAAVVIPEPSTVWMVIGLGLAGSGLWDWIGPGPTKTVLGLVCILNGLGFARKSRRKGGR